MPNFSDYIIYVDESGDHGLAHINPEFPVFVLAFCIFRKTDFADIIVPKVQRFKFRWFGHDAVILHEKEIIRKENAFSFLQNSRRAAEFMSELSDIISDAPMTVIACAIDKLRLGQRYRYPVNPYDIALYLCIERAWAFLQDGNQHELTTHIVAESRSPRLAGAGKEDRDLQICFEEIATGKHILQGHAEGIKNFDLLLASKASNSIGLQIADLIARPIGLSVLRPSQPNRAFEIIKTKIWKADEAGAGLKLFP